MITDFWGQPINEKKLGGLAAFKRAEYKRRYNASPSGKASNRKSGARWRMANPEKAKQLQKAWRDADPKRLKDSKLRSAYGITLEDQQQKFEAQGCKCAICKTSDFGKKGPQTDHCHNSKLFRGILCANCNRGLGLFKDKIEVLETAIKYLAEAKSK